MSKTAGLILYILIAGILFSGCIQQDNTGSSTLESRTQVNASTQDTTATTLPDANTVTETTPEKTQNTASTTLTNSNAQTEATTARTQETSSTTLPDANAQKTSTYFSILNASTDKILYHSSEKVNLSIYVYAEKRLVNAAITVKGLGGRMNQTRVMNLAPGLNTIVFSYKLPVCNICGGINAGKYWLSYSVAYKNTSINASTAIDIRQ
jgi:hypothetical protein